MRIVSEYYKKLTMLQNRVGPGQVQQGSWHIASHLEGSRNFKKRKKKTCTYGQKPSLNVIFS